MNVGKPFAKGITWEMAYCIYIKSVYKKCTYIGRVLNMQHIGFTFIT